ncbi:MAG TPA: DUF488 domain-containing protein [Gemmatimonadales bacterium]|nr:DUF488 domain-containing protein [Gemmatimonadales bacterium]
MIHTIGHSTLTLDEFTSLLRAHGVTALVDVRRYPASRRQPWFEGAAFAAALAGLGIDYRHEVDLGGRRRARPESPNRAWTNAAFRGFADHMQTPEFAAALERLVAVAQTASTAILCAEAVPWRCHRSLIADALTVRGIAVDHILGAGPPRPHRLSPHARIDDAGKLTYPAPA